MTEYLKLAAPLLTLPALKIYVLSILLRLYNIGAWIERGGEGKKVKI
jgi:hypothetical protein